MRSRIAILASGSGSTAEAFIRASVNGQIDTEATLVICNNPKAGIFERIEKLNSELGLSITVINIGKNTHPVVDETLTFGEQTRAEELAIIDAIKAAEVDLVALMGYMKKIGSKLVHEFGWRDLYTKSEEAMMVNTHPGLLPETKGLYGIHVQEHVLTHKLPYGGHTMHVVAENYDEGPTIVEHKILVEENDTPESLFDRVQVSEKQNLPLDIDAFIKRRQQFLSGSVV